jgi:predicted transposase YdaD
MTFAQEIREEGLREGEALGKLEEKQEIVKRQNVCRFRWILH